MQIKLFFERPKGERTLQNSIDHPKSNQKSTAWLLYIITPDEQISPPGLACKQNSLPLHSCAWYSFQLC